jgi:hypothetical protein
MSDILETTKARLSIDDARVISPRNSSARIEVPDWNTASRLVFPFLEPAPCAAGVASEVAARNAFDPLSGMLTNCIKMSLALFYQGSVIPLSESLIHEWSINVATVRLAMESNMALVARTCRFERHRRDSLVYYSLHTAAAPFNSVLPFYAPFQETAAALLGSPFYFAVPERRTAILLGKDAVNRYPSELRDDVFLTYETSSSALSTELLEVSEFGVLPIYR